MRHLWRESPANLAAESTWEQPKDRTPQCWFADDGTDPANHTGCRVQMDDIQRFIDHGRHINIVSPPRGGGVDAGDIAQGLTPRDLFPTGNPGNTRQQPRTLAYPTPFQDVVVLQQRAAVAIKGTVTVVHEDPAWLLRSRGKRFPVRNQRLHRFR